jgi:predicted ATPase
VFIIPIPCATGGLLVENEFAHDAVQQAAYSLIPDNKRDLFHLNIQRKLRNHNSNNDLHLFLIVGELRRGVELVSDPEEQCIMATLFMRAG